MVFMLTDTVSTGAGTGAAAATGDCFGDGTVDSNKGGSTIS
jgi:hypothetical protein